MKQFFFICFGLLVTGCSSDSGSSPSPEGQQLRLSSITTVTTGTSPETTITDFIYSGQNLVATQTQTDSGNWSAHYTYSGQNVTSLEYRNGFGTTTEVYSFTYSGGRVSGYSNTLFGLSNHTATFTYDQDGNISGQQRYVSGALSRELSFVYDSNRNRTSTTDTSTGSAPITWTAGFDNKTNAYRHTLPVSLQGYFGVGGNNQTSSNQDGISEQVSYTYNDAGYPVTATTTQNGTVVSTSTYEYE